MVAQASDPERLARADVVVDNAGTLEELEKAVRHGLEGIGRDLRGRPI
jgi:dephospho-CoA kinase